LNCIVTEAVVSILNCPNYRCHCQHKATATLDYKLSVSKQSTDSNIKWPEWLGIHWNQGIVAARGCHLSTFLRGGNALALPHNFTKIHAKGKGTIQLLMERTPGTSESQLYPPHFDVCWVIVHIPPATENPSIFEVISRIFPGFLTDSAGH